MPPELELLEEGLPEAPLDEDDVLPDEDVVLEDEDVLLEDDDLPELLLALPGPPLELLGRPGVPVVGSPPQATKPPNNKIDASIRLQRDNMGIQDS